MKKVDILKCLIFFNLLYLSTFFFLKGYQYRLYESIIAFTVNFFLCLYFLKTGKDEETLDEEKKDLHIHVPLYLIAFATLCSSLLFIFLSFYSPVLIGVLCGLWVYELIYVIKIAGTEIFWNNNPNTPSKTVALVGDKQSLQQVTPIIGKKKNISFIGYVDKEGFSSHKKKGSITPTSFFDNINSLIKDSGEEKIDEVFITSSAYQNINKEIDFEKLTHDAAGKAIRLRIIGTDELMPEHSFKQLHKVDGFPVLSFYGEPLSKGLNKFLKRLFDITVSGFVIVFVLSWLIPLVALLVKMESRGPVFFRQLRSGKDNKEFWCIKFRSMTPNKESDTKQATRNDMRITEVGAFLRKTSLDEFPQFINVFLGDMSITGPRPHMLKHTEDFSAQINEYMVRLYVKPGITGWAQVNGYRGETSELHQMKKRIEFDIWYIENWKFSLDLKIIFQTFLFMFKKNADVF